MTRFASDTLDFLRKNRRWVGGGFLLTLYSSFGQTVLIGVFGNDLQSTFHLSGGAFGELYMVATLASAATLPWLGRVLDLMPGWKVVRFTMPGLSFACLLLALAPNVLVLAFALYLLRLFGQGMMIETAFTEIGRWFVADRGRAMGLIVMGQQVGSSVLPAMVVLTTQATGNWRVSWFAASAALIAVGMPIAMTLLRVQRQPNPHEMTDQRHAAAKDWSRSEVLGDPFFYLLLIGTLAPGFISTVILFHQGYLIQLRHYNHLVFAAAFPVMAAMTIVFGLVCGHLIDRFGSLRLLPFMLLPLGIASAAVAAITPVWGVYAFMLLLGVSNGLTNTLLGALWPEVYGLANLGGIRGIIVSGTVLASALGPGVTGALIDIGIPLPTQMLWMAAWCAVGSLGLTLAAKRIGVREARWRTPASSTQKRAG